MNPKQKLIVDKYQTLKELGEGAYGKVILCRDTENGSKVAIKVVNQ